MKTPKRVLFLTLLPLLTASENYISAAAPQKPAFDQDAYDVALDATEKNNINTLKMLAVTGKLPTPQGALGFKLVEAAATQPTLLDYLISKGLSVNNQDANGNTVLHYAAAKGPLDDDIQALFKVTNTAFPAPTYPFNGGQIFRTLLARKANPNTTNAQGRTPLHVAAGFSGQKCIYGQAEWDYSCLNYDAADFVAKLLVAGANVNATDKQGKKPINYARSQAVKNLLTNPTSALKYLSDKDAAIKQAALANQLATQKAQAERKASAAKRRAERLARQQARAKNK